MKHIAADDELRELAALYALGALDGDGSRLLEQHLAEGCDVCDAEIKSFEDVVGTLALDAEAEQPNAEVKQRLLDNIAAIGGLRLASPKTETTGRDFISIRASEGDWKQIAPGIFEKHLFSDKARGTVTTLVRLDPGAQAPIHVHPSAEECYVIEGDFRFGDEVFGPGDYQCALVGSVHGNVHSAGGALVLIIAPESYDSVRKAELELEEQRRSLLALESKGQLWEKVEDESDSSGQEMVIEDHQERAALYALGALSEHEARAFKIHLREGCTVCSKELGEFEAVVGEMALSVGSVAPPADVIDKLLARIEKDSEIQRPVQLSSMTVPSAGTTSAARLPVSRNYIAWAVAASFFIVAVISAGAWWRTGSALAQQQRLTAGIEEEVRSLKVSLNDTSRRAQDLELITRALESPGSSMIKLARGTEQPEPKAPAKIYWNKQASQWVVALDMPVPPADKVYQLWFLAPSPVSAGVLTTDASGHGVTVIDVPGNMSKIEEAAITIEPRGGSSTPTMPIVALGAVGP